MKSRNRVVVDKAGRRRSILAFRKEVENGADKFGKIPKDIAVSSTNIADMSAEWISPINETHDKVMLYFHGGGYVTGTCYSHRGITAKFVKGTGLPAFLFEYRLAPENPYPAALDDSVKAYEWLLKQGIEPSNIVFVGD